MLISAFVPRSCLLAQKSLFRFSSTVTFGFFAWILGVERWKLNTEHWKLSTIHWTLYAEHYWTLHWKETRNVKCETGARQQKLGNCCRRNVSSLRTCALRTNFMIVLFICLQQSRLDADVTPFRLLLCFSFTFVSLLLHFFFTFALLLLYFSSTLLFFGRNWDFSPWRFCAYLVLCVRVIFYSFVRNYFQTKRNLIKKIRIITGSIVILVTLVNKQCSCLLLFQRDNNKKINLQYDIFVLFHHLKLWWIIFW